jgi:type II secretory pathway component PulK
LWVLFFLASLALAVSSLVSTDLGVASQQKRDVPALHLARGGAEWAMFACAADTNSWDGLVADAWNNARDLFEANLSLETGSFSVFYTYESDGMMVTNYGVVGEERNINLNKADERLLRALFEGIGKMDPSSAERVAACVRDWRDRDDDQLTGGAEKTYYQSLIDPYPCHNGDLQSVYELRLIRGVDETLMEQVTPHVTVFGSGKVNINLAAPEVLECVALASGGDSVLSESVARKIVRFREEGRAFTTASGAEISAQLNAAVGLTGAESSLLARMFSYLTVRSSCFCATVTGSTSPGRAIRFVYDRERRQVLQWQEE